MSESGHSAGNEERLKGVWVFELPMDVALDAENDGVDEGQTEQRRRNASVQAHRLWLGGRGEEGVSEGVRRGKGKG